MVELIMIYVGVLIMYELKSSIDAIGFSNVPDKDERRSWHIYAWLYIVTVSVLIGYGYTHGFCIQFWLVLLYMALLRSSYFPIRLNKKRKKVWHHLGTEGWDKCVRKVFRNNTKLFFYLSSLLTIGAATSLWILRV